MAGFFILWYYKVYKKQLFKEFIMARRKEKNVESALEMENERLKKTIRDKDKVIKQKDRTIRQLKSEAKTAMDGFSGTESFLREVTNGKPLSEVIKTVKRGDPLSDEIEPCPKCGSREIVTLIYTGFFIKTCLCGYRKRFNEEQEIEKP